jgi:hypothetical protein
MEGGSVVAASPSLRPSAERKPHSPQKRDEWAHPIVIVESNFGGHPATRLICPTWTLVLIDTFVQ